SWTVKKSPLTCAAHSCSEPMSQHQNRERPCARGKFLFLGDQKLYVRGVTYGPFRPGQDGSEYPDPRQVARDFEGMSANGINAIRTYSVPPTWVLDEAHKFGLHVMVGLPWEQHITFLDEPGRGGAITDRVRAAMRGCAGH